MWDWVRAPSCQGWYSVVPTCSFVVVLHHDAHFVRLIASTTMPRDIISGAYMYICAVHCSGYCDTLRCGCVAGGDAPSGARSASRTAPPGLCCHWPCSCDDSRARGSGTSVRDLFGSEVRQSPIASICSSHAESFLRGPFGALVLESYRATAVQVGLRASPDICWSGGPAA